ncbi:TPA: 50S ribosomal protein L34e [Candidatus Micrarchaeota archaeon]|nr:50S ribosomal protein L34e [Candidatus Micrarchaeota archaeon]HIH29810.1 50S ribosomal protein L34e [Candidatus Micrarchaeota archaeon]
MTLPRNRSNSVRRIYKRTPKGATVHYRRIRKGNVHACGLSGARLQGVSSERSLHKGARRPNRKFGGSLSSAAASRVIVIATRVKEGAMPLEEVNLKMLPYVKRYLASK